MELFSDYSFIENMPVSLLFWQHCCWNKLSTGFSVPHIYGLVLVLNDGAWLKMLGILWYTTIKASRRVFVAQYLDNELYKNGTQSKPKHCSLASRSSAFLENTASMDGDKDVVFMCCLCIWFIAFTERMHCIQSWKNSRTQDNWKTLMTTTIAT